MSGTIADWEREQFEGATTRELAALVTVEPDRTIEGETDPDIPELVAVMGRINSGLGVQLLVEPVVGGRAFITLALDGETETFEVPSKSALDAFEHPFTYGGTLL